MKQRLVARGFAVSALAAFLTACAGPPAPQSLPRASALTFPLSLHPSISPRWLSGRSGGAGGQGTMRGSWMPSRAKSQALMYVSNPFEFAVDVYSYVTFEPIGEIAGFAEPLALCVDGAQDVYVADFARGSIVEFPHGSVIVRKTLLDHHGAPISCAVDPKSGDLAVANFIGPSSGAGNVLIYRGAKGNPDMYEASGFDYYYFVGYDPDGNLFVDGRDFSGNFMLAELPNGKSTFKSLTPDRGIGLTGGLGWDGKFVAVGDQSTNTIYQFKISGSQAIVKGSTALQGASDVFQFWFAGPKRGQATMVVGADDSANAVHKWFYPAGGSPLQNIGGLDQTQGVTISK